MLQVKVNCLATDRANTLSRIQDLLVPVELSSMLAIMVWSVALSLYTVSIFHMDPCLWFIAGVPFFSLRLIINNSKSPGVYPELVHFLLHYPRVDKESYGLRALITTRGGGNNKQEDSFKQADGSNKKGSGSLRSQSLSMPLYHFALCTLCTLSARCITALRLILYTPRTEYRDISATFGAGRLPT